MDGKVGALEGTGRQSRLTERQIQRRRDMQQQVDTDVLSVEEPLEIRLGKDPIAVVMRTPCDDFDLAAGFLYTEGIIDRPTDIGAISYCTAAQPPNQENTLEVRLSDGVDFDTEQLRRNFYASSSCGVCGKASIEAIRLRARPLTGHFQIAAETLYQLDQRLRQGQAVFEKTGSLHAAGLFDPAGKLLVLREDVGRHNAVDKVVGHYVLGGQRPPDPAILMVSGRTSFEILQKALMAGIGAVAAVSAPSSLAVDFAREAGMTLIGFLRGRGCNVYAGAERIYSS